VALDDVAEPEDPTPGAEARLQDSARYAALRDAMAALPERQRVALTLRHFEGATNPEIAAALGVSVEAVESLTARAKRALAQALRGRVAALGYEG
jgi:RNA polymerase sigma-70 factor (ECF subfamily)